MFCSLVFCKIILYSIIIGIEIKQSVLPSFHYISTVYNCETEDEEVVSMIELVLIETIYLLFFGLVGVTIINVTLIIALAIIMCSKR